MEVSLVYQISHSLFVLFVCFKAFCTEKVTPDTDDPKKNLMVQRRSILLAVVAGTPADSPTLEKVLAEGYLNAVKIWLDDVLEHAVGKSITAYCTKDHFAGLSPFLQSRFC